MKNEKAYYAIIPANVRYCPTLSAHAKLFYGEMTALCNDKGYCWATNTYFSKLYEVNRATISVWVRALEERGFIKCTMKNNNMRRIYLAGGVLEKSNRGIRKNRGGVLEKSNTLYNNTLNNTKNTLGKKPAKKVRSLFPLFEDTKIKNSFDEKCVIKLHTALHQKRKIYKAIQVVSWIDSFKKLRTLDKFKKRQIQKVLNWYVDNIGKEFVPEAYSAGSFRKKMFQICSAMEKDKNPRKAHDGDDTEPMNYKVKKRKSTK